MSSTPTERQSWTAAGADEAAQRTYAAVQNALADLQRRHGLEIFLQGSYANTTNIRADSDVDVVVMTRTAFRGSTERLGPVARAMYDNLPRADYGAGDLRSDVTAALVEYFGDSRVHPRNKCIRVDKRDGYVDADVVPCIEYRWYRQTNAGLTTPYVEGIAIHPRSGDTIVNFPKEHIANGKTKNSLCGGHYKKTVRQMKHLRNRAERDGYLQPDISPGYLLECMTFNTPPERFCTEDSKRLQDVVLWLKYADKASFHSCDQIHRLFQTDPGDFDVATAQRIVDALWEAY